MFINVQVVYFGNVLYMFHVGCITSRPKNAGNFGLWVDVMRCNKCSRRVVDQRSKFDR